MNDPREAILVQVLAILDEVDGITTVERNQNDFSEFALPALVLIDGDEEANAEDPEARPTTAPRRVTLKAEIVVLASAPPESIGTVINGFRAAVIRAVQTDPTLISLVMDGNSRQSIRYNGSTVQMSSGRAIEADMRLDFSFVYVLSPATL